MWPESNFQEALAKLDDTRKLFAKILNYIEEFMNQVYNSSSKLDTVLYIFLHNE